MCGNEAVVEVYWVVRVTAGQSESRVIHGTTNNNHLRLALPRPALPLWPDALMLGRNRFKCLVIHRDRSHRHQVRMADTSHLSSVRRIIMIIIGETPIYDNRINLQSQGDVLQWPVNQPDASADHERPGWDRLSLLGSVAHRLRLVRAQRRLWSDSV